MTLAPSLAVSDVRLLRALLEALPDAVLAIDPDARVVAHNAAARSLLGAELTAVALGDVLPFLVEPRGDDPRSVVAEVLAERRPVEFTGERPREGERAVRLAGRGAPITEDGALHGVVFTIRDVTAERQLQEQLERADRLSALATLSSGVAHEVNNPLSVIVGNADYAIHALGRSARAAGAGTTPHALLAAVPELTSAQEEIKTAADRIRAIVAELRSFARAAPSGVRRCRVEGALAWAMRATGRELQARAVVEQDVAAAPEVALEEVRLGQVLVALLLNSTHAIAPENPRAHRVSVRASAGPGGVVVIEVADTGAGMSDAVRRRMFEPFFTTRPGATGLGLPVAHGIVTNAGGRLEAESVAGVGTTVRVVLPAFDPAAAPAESAGARSSPLPAGGPPRP